MPTIFRKIIILQALMGLFLSATGQVPEEILRVRAEADSIEYVALWSNHPFMPFFGQPHRISYFNSMGKLTMEEAFYGDGGRMYYDHYFYDARGRLSEYRICFDKCDTTLYQYFYDGSGRISHYQELLKESQQQFLTRRTYTGTAFVDSTFLEGKIDRITWMEAEDRRDSVYQYNENELRKWYYNDSLGVDSMVAFEYQPGTQIPDPATQKRLATYSYDYNSKGQLTRVGNETDYTKFFYWPSGKMRAEVYHNLSLQKTEARWMGSGKLGFWRN